MTEHAIEQWIEKAIPPGSGRYYALLHADNNPQPLRAIATLISIWSKLAFNNREIEIARRKLDWWRDELHKDTCQHPITNALQAHLLERPALREQLIEILKGYGSLLEHGSPSTDQANQTFHALTGGTSCVALCDSELTNQDRDAVVQAGIVLSRFRCLRYLRQHVACGLLCLPLTSLEAADVTPDMLTIENNSDSLKEFLDNALSATNNDLQASLTQLANCHAAVKPVYIYSFLQQKLVTVMQQDKANLLQHEIRLTPIKNYWHAFRAARRFDKTLATSQ